MSDENYFMRFSQLRDDVRHLQYDVNDKLKELEDENKKLRVYMKSIAINTCCDRCQEASRWARQCLKELEK